MSESLPTWISKPIILMLERIELQVAKILSIFYMEISNFLPNSSLSYYVWGFPLNKL